MSQAKAHVVAESIAALIERRSNESMSLRHQVEIRLTRARALVLETQLPLAMIALEVGFANQGHLGNRFRRRFGVPPGALRRASATSTLPVE